MARLIKLLPAAIYTSSSYDYVVTGTAPEVSLPAGAL
jgi:hypothetical protein